ncbi:ABC transporter substrate-binding protein [Paraburkholderia sp. 22099]|jgi:branched-chain amino acid transport system substrate-binding protein|uniref:ABC transporter substrate-binding protein n=1 Tax=Paraburkholderia TaxID=1822464 RepID=UPI002860AEDA|nr:ABC transporter substrate-binding protein [Paraburkholderia terricola]MDR6496471.1 branched-chain amino acid transport system substrate-binding protein [Paraburkholderia terricola]
MSILWNNKRGAARTLLQLAGALTIAFGAAMPAANAADPYWIGVTGPLSGQDAQYGEQWKRGFDLALEQINGNGGINGHPLSYDFEDSRSDPRQTVAIAQKFVDDKRILLELGDLSSGASMAASPVYQRAGLVQFGFTNSHPDFTKGGDYMWSTAISQAEEQPMLAHYVTKGLGFKKIAVLYLNTDWGRTSKDIFAKAAASNGAQVVAAEAYQPNEKDFRATLTRVRSAEPDSIVLISYYSDGAQIVRQARAAGVHTPIAAVGSVYSPKFLDLGGPAVNGVYTESNFFPGDPRPEVQSFVQRYRAKYGAEPDTFAARAYDAMILASEVIRRYGADRTALHDGFAKINDVPSVIFGKFKFDPQTRRVAGAKNLDLVIKDGKFALWDGVSAVRPQ